MMRVSVDHFRKPCGCRSAGECSCNATAEFDALDQLVDRFAAAMKSKLRLAAMERGKSGWDDPNWHPEAIRLALFDHVAKGDAVDVANFAAFLWNRS
ncbi:MAG: hypothetical protein JJ902_22665 [Roseibium sp.]|nr:hypothetical protein [Roseibium sp.]